MYVYIRLFKMSARLWALIKEGGCCSTFLCKCSSHDMPENLQYYNNANKNGKLWILYRCIKKCNFSVTWITLRIATLALWKKAALRFCFVFLCTSCYLTSLRTEIIEENLTQGYTLKDRWDSLRPPLCRFFPLRILLNIAIEPSFLNERWSCWWIKLNDNAIFHLFRPSHLLVLSLWES